MNTPNKLTILRIIMAPFFLAALLIKQIPHHYAIALVIFVAASLTDLADGKIARKYNLITDFGKFLDPLADKMLVTAALVGFVELGHMGSAACYIILVREFLVTSLRLVASGGGTVIAASIWGKLKTVFQMIAIITILFVAELMAFPFIKKIIDPWAVYAGSALMWIAVALTVISGITYMWAYRSHIDHRK